MNRFYLLYEDWELAERAAVAAELCVSQHLDAWCDGAGRAPSPDEVAAAKGLRRRARECLHVLKAHLSQVREEAPVI
ncbi:hypothetical protein [Ramlibacter sp.]|uniref:hypothetical protein n=1 Tax=Ramlibacter sp. TaxID=1917967 RepID=UPI002C7AD2AB|nr:hypothetical protein [Ramlibacter sp.]HWI81340.1 hypothetical protein [Ramlibacter sp.]